MTHPSHSCLRMSQTHSTECHSRTPCPVSSFRLYCHSAFRERLCQPSSGHRSQPCQKDSTQLPAPHSIQHAHSSTAITPHAYHTPNGRTACSCWCHSSRLLLGIPASHAHLRQGWRSACCWKLRRGPRSLLLGR